MENEELKKVLNRLDIPEPSEEARDRAVRSAMAEFRMATKKNKDRVKGFAWLDRLISKKPKGGFFMNRTIAISAAGLAASVIIFAIVYSPTMISEMKSKTTQDKTLDTPIVFQKKSVTRDQKEQGQLQSAGNKTLYADTSGNISTSETIPTVSTGEEIPKTARDTSSQKGQVVSEPTVSVNVDGAYNSTNNTGQSLYDVERVEQPYSPQQTEEKYKEFALEEITTTAQKREETQQKVPISMDVISGEGLSESRERVAYESAAAAKGKAEAEMAAAKAKALSYSATELSGNMRVSLNQPAPTNENTLYAISGTRVNNSDSLMMNPEYTGRDKFEDIKTNTVKLVSEEPVSTFSIDVDTSSYAFVRRALNNGYLPQADSVRIEELINYFDYYYPLPKDKSEPFKPTVAIFQTPWNANTKLLHIGIKGYDIVPDKKPRANLTFLIDVSGSMQSEDKLPLLKNSLRMLVDTLSPDDTVAIVTYAGASAIELDRTGISDKSKILAAIDRLRAGGSTAGAEGIRTAYSLAEAGMDPKGINRVILATDGDFNVGITDKDVLQDFVERKRKTGIYLSVLGFGQGNYNDELMQKLAQNGNGNAAYIDTLNEARKVLVDEAKGTLFTIAKDVKIQVEFNPDMVSEYRLIGYETRQLNREDFKNDSVDAGDIGSGHSVTAIYEITPKGSDAQLIDDLRYGTKNDSEAKKKSGNASEYAFLKIRYKLPDEDTSREISTPIDKANEYKKISDAPADARFASAVAAFGQLLRGDSYINQYTYDDVIALASGAKKDDSFGYRTEFINLVRLAKTASAMGDR